LLWGFGFFVFALLAAFCLLKYHLFLYNGIDLAYFNQVFWNFLHGRFFTQSIHPHSSLGDHAELIIPLLVPFYALFPDPRTLLILQTIFLLLPAIPLYFLAKHRVSSSSLIPFLITALYLLSPIVHNILLFEFHVLAFALLPLFVCL